MTRSIAVAWLAMLLASSVVALAAKPRLVVLTDIGGDPDDQQSMIRLLLHSNELDIEGLLATAAGTPGELKEAVTKPHLIREIVDAYGKVHGNLVKHAEGFPNAAELLKVVQSGNPNRGREFIGDGRDTDGSRWIIACADTSDPRPLNIAIWGGQTDFAQALWRIRKDRGEDGLKKFQAAIRVFDIDDQDKLHEWLFAEFPDVFYVLSKAPQGADKRLGAYRGMYLGGDESLTSLRWLDEHVRKNHGPLGALYPAETWTAPNPNSAMKEGDTPSWFFFLPFGLSDPAHPEWGSLGGRYQRVDRGLFRDVQEAIGDVTDSRVGVWRWRPAMQNEFAARMDWCVSADFKTANHPPSAVLNDDKTRDIVFLTKKTGESFMLSSASSTDPDGNALATRWNLDRESDIRAELSPEKGESTRVTITGPEKSGEVHIIMTLQDDGQPSLTRYRRAVIQVGAK